MRQRVYLDHAATRFPKPSVVIEAMRDYSISREAAVGRGAYRSSREASDLFGKLRAEIAKWIDADDPNDIAVQPGGTQALNTAIFGYLRPGDHVVTTDAEHNSVLRPLHALVEEGRIRWTKLAVDGRGCVDPNKVLDAVGESTRLVAVVHAANVNGAIQEIEVVGQELERRFAGKKPALLVDAAQTFGYLPIQVRRSGVDMLAAPGHKGGSGPLGTGFLFANKKVQKELRPLLFGGTGSQSESLEMPRQFPTAFEAGNQNVPAAFGWLAGLTDRRGESSAKEWLDSNTHRLARVASNLYDRLRSIPGVEILGEVSPPRLPIASIRIQGYQPDEVAMILDSEFGIEVRSGKHCAACIHEHLGSTEGGTLRISGCECTTDQELTLLEQALREIAASADAD